MEIGNRDACSRSTACGRARAPRSLTSGISSAVTAEAERRSALGAASAHRSRGDTSCSACARPGGGRHGPGTRRARARRSMLGGGELVVEARLDREPCPGAEHLPPREPPPRAQALSARCGASSTHRHRAAREDPTRPGHAGNQHPVLSSQANAQLTGGTRVSPRVVLGSVHGCRTWPVCSGSRASWRRPVAVVGRRGFAASRRNV